MGTMVPARMGIGFDYCFSQKFAVDFEAALLRFLEDDPLWALGGGIGFKFGALPAYGTDPAAR